MSTLSPALPSLRSRAGSLEGRGDKVDLVGHHRKLERPRSAAHVPARSQALPHASPVPRREGSEIIVVDNASSDGSPEMVRSRVPRSTAHPERGEPGVHGSQQPGLWPSAGDRYLLLLNPDTEVVGDALATMARVHGGAPARWAHWAHNSDTPTAASSRRAGAFRHWPPRSSRARCSRNGGATTASCAATTWPTRQTTWCSRSTGWWAPA